MMGKKLKQKLKELSSNYFLEFPPGSFDAVALHGLWSERKRILMAKKFVYSMRDLSHLEPFHNLPSY